MTCLFQLYFSLFQQTKLAEMAEEHERFGMELELTTLGIQLLCRRAKGPNLLENQHF